MSGKDQDDLRQKRLQAMGLLPKSTPAASEEGSDNPMQINGHIVNNAEPTVEPVPNNEPKDVQLSNVLPPITISFNIYPNDPVALENVVSGLAKALTELCSLSGVKKAQPSKAQPSKKAQSSSSSVPLASMAVRPVSKVKPLPSKPFAIEEPKAASSAQSKNDSWLSDCAGPVNRSTPKSQSDSESESDHVIVLPSDDSRDLFSDDAEEGACGPAPPKAPVKNWRESMPGVVSWREDTPGPSSSTGAIRKGSTSLSLGFNQGSKSAATGDFSKESDLARSSQRSKLSKKLLAIKSAMNSSSSASEKNLPVKPKSDKKGNSNLMSQMAAFFKTAAHGKDMSNKRGQKHLLTDTSDQQSSPEVMPKKKVRAEPPKDPNPNPDQDDDPYLGRCSICLENPKNCKIRCRHVFCEPCLKSLKKQKKGCPFDGFRFRTWEKLF